MRALAVRFRSGCCARRPRTSRCAGGRLIDRPECPRLHRPPRTGDGGQQAAPAGRAADRPRSWLMAVRPSRARVMDKEEEREPPLSVRFRSGCCARRPRTSRRAGGRLIDRPERPGSIVGPEPATAASRRRQRVALLTDRAHGSWRCGPRARELMDKEEERETPGSAVSIGAVVDDPLPARARRRGGLRVPRVAVLHPVAEADFEPRFRGRAVAHINFSEAGFHKPCAMLSLGVGLYFVVQTTADLPP